MPAPADLGPLWLSLRVAARRPVLIVLVGLPAACCLARLQFPGKGLVAGVLILPLVLPPTVLGYLLLQVLGAAPGWAMARADPGRGRSCFTGREPCVASAVAAFPLFLLPRASALEAVDPALEDAARLLGTSASSRSSGRSLCRWPGAGWRPEPCWLSPGPWAISERR